MLLEPQQEIIGIKDSTITNFWQWAYSDILSNRNRSIFAEYLVAKALNLDNTARIEWDSKDLSYKGINIEVKSSAYAQSWGQNKESKISFDIEKKKGILGLFSKKPKIAIHLDNRDLWKTSILNAMKERKFGQKISDGYRIDGEGRIICSLCGTHYEELKAKIVQCSECKKFICREKQEGMFSKKWIKTDCFDNKKMLCIVCSRKK